MNRVTPRWMYGGLVATLALSIGQYSLMGNYGWVRLTSRAIAYAVATAFCLQIAREYPRKSLLRTAWLLFAGDAGISIVGSLLDSDLLVAAPGLHVYQHLAILVSLICLLAGMSAMAWAFLRTGLGFSIHRSDAVAMAAVFGFLSLILIRHEYLSEARSPLSVSRYLQLVSQGALAAAAAAAVVLHRLSLDMGGGKLAVTMKFLIVHTAMRVLLVLDNVMFGSFLHAHPAAHFTADFCFDATAWIFALAACYRALMFTQILHQAPPALDELLAASSDGRWSHEVVAVSAGSSEPAPPLSGNQ